jgi:hypothetical protein
VDAGRNLAVGVDFVGVAGSQPDAVALYDITDTSTPALIGHYPFPVNQVANANFICQTVVSGWKAFSLDANNGLVGFYINPPANSMLLNIAPSGNHVNLSWGESGAVLQSSPTLNSASWTDLTPPGQTNSLQPASGTTRFFRLLLRR